METKKNRNLLYDIFSIKEIIQLCLERLQGHPFLCETYYEIHAVDKKPTTTTTTKKPIKKNANE
jgi:hypothetical protein